MQPLERSRKRKQAKEERFPLTRCRTTKPVVNLVEGDSDQRSWDELPRDILVGIMKHFTFHQKTFALRFIVCKSWLSALLDSIFPPGDVLDLRVFDQMDSHYKQAHKVFGNYLWMVLNRRSHQYTKVLLPRRSYCTEFFDDLAKRLPALKCVVLHRNFAIESLPSLRGMFFYWPELMEAHCHTFLVREIATHCKHIRKLGLYGWIRDDKAKWIANKLPQLEYLDIQSCVLSSRALTIILDGQKELKHLDTRHAAGFDDGFLCRNFGNCPFGKAIGWNEEEIRSKVSGIVAYMSCPRRSCPDCSVYYDTSVSPHGNFAWSFHLAVSRRHERGYPCLSRSCVLLKSPDAKPNESCLVKDFGKILPDNFKPIGDDSRLFAFRY